ncbi:trans-2-enoyl-CoA reductase [Coprinopsis sp. MPI-PUGE-AT-0042]|nr:trans-2-enoyl-CoA reductase [Coprinopsis sp. MPI-PUGE-AT-0042]
MLTSRAGLTSLRSVKPCAPSRLYRLLSTTRPCLGRAVVYTENGDPSSVLDVISIPPIPATPPPNSVNIKFLLSPINPADINVIEGVYPSQPTKTDALTPSGKGSEGYPVFVGGNEGLAEVTAVGEGAAASFKVGDWVIITKQQSGTWMTERNIPLPDVARLPEAGQLTQAQGATITVNPPTAYNMLHDFVKLEKGDWVIQNGANSAVGQAVIQIAAAEGYKTINLVRSRDNIDTLKKQLTDLGATHVLTYEELADKATREKIKEWTGRKPIRLGLNCVGGKETTLMARYLGQDAQLVSYGAMSKQPLSLPTSLFIFKNLIARGFWQSVWYKKKPIEERDELMAKLVGYISSGKLETPEHEVLHITGNLSDEEAAAKVRDTFKKLSEGKYGKKVLLKVD